MNQRVYVFPSIFPTSETEQENRVICVSGLGSNKPFQTLMASLIPCFDLSKRHNAFPSTPTTKMVQTAAKTSPIGR